MLDQNALHGNASLPGVGESSGDAAVGGVGEIGIAVHDDTGVAPEFEHDFFLSRQCSDGPADRRAAGKADELDALVGDQQAGIFVREWQHIESAIRPSGLLNHSASNSAESGVCGAGFSTMEQPAAMAGATLCATRFSGKLKGVMPATGPEGKAFDNAPAAGGGLLPVQRKIFAVPARAFFGGDVEGKNGAINFAARAL